MEFWALEAAGVDNWSGWDYAVEIAEEEGHDWSDLSDEDKLYYLEIAGVDNWRDWDYALEILEKESE